MIERKAEDLDCHGGVPQVRRRARQDRTTQSIGRFSSADKRRVREDEQLESREKRRFVWN